MLMNRYWIQDTLTDFPHETAALLETRMLRDSFASAPVTSSNFGLIHYDFEYDNVFYEEETKSCNVIDFDDAMYHWYAMDIEQALDSLHDYIPDDLFSRKKQCFLDGYLTEYDLSDDDASILPACRRFANLYGYALIVRSIAEEWTNEPEWLVQLRERLAGGLKEKASYFGMKL
jgi:Ser/Thr protein kinase RdoA (MazF antagonist)